MSNLFDPRKLGRLSEYDERTKRFLAVRGIESRTARSWSWSLDKWLDQGMEGSCVGFAFGHSALAKPSLIWSVDEQVARGIYFSAQLVDEWEGGAYPGIDPNSPEYYEGTSVLAGAKAARELGHFNNYEWAYNVNDLILAVGYKGPAVLGIYWFWGMDNVNEQGYVVPSGDIAGGHAIIIIGVNIKERYFLLQNSWSKEWGVNGRCKISFDDMDLLLGLDGEACVPLLRRMPYTIGGGKQIRIAS